MNRVTAMIYRLCLEAPAGKVRMARVEMPDGGAPRGVGRCWYNLPAPRCDLEGFFHGTERAYPGYEDACSTHVSQCRQRWGDWQCGTQPESFHLWWPPGELLDIAIGTTRDFYENLVPVLRVLEFDVSDVLALPHQYIMNPASKTVVATLVFDRDDLFFELDDWRDHQPLRTAAERGVEAIKVRQAPQAWDEPEPPLPGAIWALPEYIEWAAPVMDTKMAALYEWAKKLSRGMPIKGMNLQQIPKIDTG